MEGEAIVAALLVVMVVMLVRCQKQQERFLPSQTWDDWDNYDKDQGNTRAYWGGMDEEGGWTGNAAAPGNDPSGFGFGASSPNYGRRYGRSALVHRKKEVNLAQASDSELAAEYRMGIMANK
jgi:hypothetical protein